MSKTDDPSLLIGVFYDRAHAERAFRELQQGGFGDGQLSVALLDGDGPPEAPPVRSQPTQARTGAAVGIAVGTVLGALLGVLTALWLSIFGWAIVLGQVVAIATAAGAGLGALVGTLIGRTIRPDEPRPFVSRLHQNRGIVTVRAHTRYEEAAAILRRHAGCDSDPASATETVR